MPYSLLEFSVCEGRAGKSIHAKSHVHSELCELSISPFFIFIFMPTFRQKITRHQCFPINPPKAITSSPQSQTLKSIHESCQPSNRHAALACLWILLTAPGHLCASTLHFPPLAASCHQSIEAICILLISLTQRP